MDESPESIVAAKVARLTPVQLETMRLVQQRLTTKEIADRLGVSDHAVASRIKDALARLGTNRRPVGAAILDAYDRQIPPSAWGQSQGVATSDLFQPMPLPTTGDPLPTQEPMRDSFSRHWHSARQQRWPIDLEGGADNDLSKPMRLFWIVAIAIAAPMILANLAFALRASKTLWQSL
ncbi:sigma factor-like helix-turn-helix DNA-binding protein [Sphingomonas sp. ABOLH]|uniref:sigma factor-like helix-turn-helix DNA-binding protein n=1 Tax=Sphingomonas sp. ABOLH TaxID=1985881 RepID=UPI000F7E4EE3|nr:sigma factor-like helix-turn-helix DNA-binding protein [Sphingomonas sp. ABOLH]RSV32156.1 hypothetical protein CA237_03560 [Sphingomonas sp. ABOLH]